MAVLILLFTLELLTSIFYVAGVERINLGAIGDVSQINFPLTNENQAWFVTGPEDSKLILTFTEFDLGSHVFCSSHSIMVYTYQRLSNTPEFLSSYCGQLSPFSVASNSKNLAFRITSNGYSVGTGFKANITVVSGYCGETFRSLSGVIEAPTYLGQYPNNMICTYAINTRPGSRVVLKVERVDFGTNDYIRVLEGAKAEGKHLKSITSNTSQDIISYADGMFVYFSSDAESAGGGYKLSFTVEEVDECLKSLNGIEYVGTTNITRSGSECWFWNTYANLNFHENFCRNPNSADSPWCFVGENQREPCSISQCGSKTSTVSIATTAVHTKSATEGEEEDEQEEEVERVTMGAIPNNGGGNKVIPDGDSNNNDDTLAGSSNNDNREQNGIVLPIAIIGGILMVVVAMVIGVMAKRKQTRPKSKRTPVKSPNTVTVEPATESTRYSYTTIDIDNECVVYRRNRERDTTLETEVEANDVTYSVIENIDHSVKRSSQNHETEKIEENIYEEATEELYDHLGDKRDMADVSLEGDYGEIEGDDTYDHTNTFRKPIDQDSNYDHLEITN